MFAKTLRSNAIELWQAWDTATLRIINKAQPDGLAEGRRLTTAFGLGCPDRKTQKAVRALLTGYLLYALAGDKTYRDFADPDVQLPKTVALDDGRALGDALKRSSSRCSRAERINQPVG